MCKLRLGLMITNPAVCHCANILSLHSLLLLLVLLLTNKDHNTITDFRPYLTQFSLETTVKLYRWLKELFVILKKGGVSIKHLTKL